VEGNDVSLIVEDLAATIRTIKRDLKTRIPEVRRNFAEVEDHIRREVDDIVDGRGRGQPGLT
jgi:predicted fused transcriptional regulator/phosphomethylpyrimidine kinase